MINWHRLFGLSLINVLSRSPYGYEVELEKELSLKKQFLDIVIVKKISGAPVVDVPVGLENLANITY